VPPLKWGDDETYGIQVDVETRTVTVRQSWLNTFLDCPERGRLSAIRAADDGPSDATAIGTAMHFAVEEALNAIIDGRPPLDLDDMLQAFHNEFATIAEHGEGGVPMRWVKRKPIPAKKYGESMVERFYNYVLPHLNPVATEVGFGPVTLGVSASGWTVRVQGSIDCVDYELGLVDWKSASRVYTPWEKRRWSVQPTVYLAAAQAEGLTLETDGGIPDVFHYVVMPDVPPENRDWIQLIQVTRAGTQREWLVDQVADIATLVERMGFDVAWPKRDQHALCSEKWCPYWSGCKGKFLGDDPPDWKSSVSNVTLGSWR
jgi:hypothetical protein